MMDRPLLPPALDMQQMLRDLNEWGWRDYKIEIACGWNKGYVSQVKCGNIGQMFYTRQVALNNFWATIGNERDRSIAVSHGTSGTLPINRLESTYESA
jgi:hypothetical protein